MKKITKLLLKEKFQKLAGILNEQDPIKDIVGECQNKTQIALENPSGVTDAWLGWMNSTNNPEEVANDPYFNINGNTTVSNLVYNILQETQGGGEFEDYYFDANPTNMDMEIEPYCPYIYLFQVPISMQLCTDNGCQILGNGINATNAQDVLAYFMDANPDLDGISVYASLFAPLGIPAPTSITELLNAFLAYCSDQNSVGCVSLVMPDSIMAYPCDCVWIDQIAGCMDDTAFNYNPEANNACSFPNIAEPNDDCCTYCDVTTLEDVGDTGQLGTCCDELIATFMVEDDTLCSACCGVDESLTSTAACNCCAANGFACTEGCMEPSALNYNENANYGDTAELCEFAMGCTNPEAFNYDPNAVINDGSCVPVVVGCMDTISLTYNPNANTEDVSLCLYLAGCTDPTADNYNPDADSSDDSCVYQQGCMDPEAQNFNPAADYQPGGICNIEDTGDCCYYNPGCTDPNMFNFNPEADLDDGSCIPIVYGCTVEDGGWNYDPDNPANTPYDSAVAYVNQAEGDISYLSYVEYLLQELNMPTAVGNTAVNLQWANFLENYNTQTGCIEMVPGCTDYMNACNFGSPNATYSYMVNIDDGSCDYESCYGCIDPGACNYDPLSVFQAEGACDYESCQACLDTEYACNAIDPINLIGVVISNSDLCDYESCVGCMDPNAVNYDPDATIQSGIGGASGPCLYDDEIAPDSPDELEAEPDKDIPDIPDPEDPDVVTTAPERDPPKDIPDVTLSNDDDDERPERPYEPELEDDDDFPIGNDVIGEPSDSGCTDPFATNYDEEANFACNGDNSCCDYVCNMQSCETLCNPDSENFNCEDCWELTSVLMNGQWVSASYNYEACGQPPAQSTPTFPDTTSDKPRDVGNELTPLDNLSVRPDHLNYNHWHQNKPRKDSRNLNESFVKRLQKLANIKKKK